MPPQTNSSFYQNQEYGARTESDIRPKEEPVIKQCSEGICRPKKAHQLWGKTFIIIPQEIVDKLCINEDTWFQQELINNGIVLRILNWNEKGGPI